VKVMGYHDKENLELDSSCIAEAREKDLALVPDNFKESIKG